MSSEGIRDHSLGSAHTKLLLYTSSEFDFSLEATWVPSRVWRVRFLQSLRGSMSFGTKSTSSPRVFPSSNLKAKANAAASLRVCKGSAVKFQIFSAVCWTLSSVLRCDWAAPIHEMLLYSMTDLMNIRHTALRLMELSK